MYSIHLSEVLCTNCLVSFLFVLVFSINKDSGGKKSSVSMVNTSPPRDKTKIEPRKEAFCRKCTIEAFLEVLAHRYCYYALFQLAQARLCVTVAMTQSVVVQGE